MVKISQWVHKNLFCSCKKNYLPIGGVIELHVQYVLEQGLIISFLYMKSM